MGFLPDRSEVVVRHILERQAVQFPEKQCMLFDESEETWTYKRALKEAYCAANVLIRQGIKRNENVLIFLPNGPDFIRAWFGITFLGAVFVPVNTAYKGEMLRHVCRDSSARHIITSPDLAKRLRDIRLELKNIDPKSLTSGPADEPKLDAPIEPWDVCAIIYTSGTTGLSKGVIVPHLHLIMWGRATWERATKHDTILNYAPLFHGGSLWMCICLWTVGGRVVLQKKFSAKNLLDKAREFGITIVTMFGSIVDYLMAQPVGPDDADNPIRLMGAQSYGDVTAFMERFGITDVSVGYGMTETGAPIVNPSRTLPKPGSSGKVRKGAQVRLVDDHDIPVSVGEVGECIVRTDRPWEMNAGYWNNPEATAKAWRNGWFHTGDLLRCDEEGNYFFVDRKKDAVRRRGENISSFEVEREVLAYPEILEAACVGAPSEYGEDEVKVFVIPRDPAGFDAAELIQFLVPRMPDFMVPRFIEVVSEFPRTPSTLRIQKHELRARGNSKGTWDREKAGIGTKKDN